MLDDDEREFYRAWKAEGKRRYRAHVERNKEDYKKWMEIMRKMGGNETPVGAGFRYDFPLLGFKIDFWPQSGKWTRVGSNVYNLGPRKMVKYVKGHREPITITPDPSKPLTGRKANIVIVDDPSRSQNNNGMPPWEVD